MANPPPGYPAYPTEPGPYGPPPSYPEGPAPPFTYPTQHPPQPGYPEIPPPGPNPHGYPQIPPAGSAPQGYPQYPPSGPPPPQGYYPPVPSADNVSHGYPQHMAAGQGTRHFFIRSQMNDLVLDIKGGQSHPGTKVITWQKKTGSPAANQLWYEDAATGTIRTKLNDFCMDLQDNTLVVNPAQPGKQDQQWTMSGNQIRNRINPNRVLDIAEANQREGARICRWEFTGADNQQWTQDFVDGGTPPPSFAGYVAQPSRPTTQAGAFYLESELHGKVLDVKDGNSSPGVDIIVWEKSHDQPNQLWYIDKYNLLRSKLNDFVLDSSNSGRIQMHPWQQGSPYQLWSLRGNRIVNLQHPHQVLEIQNGSHANGARVVVSNNHSWSPSQQWRLVYQN